MCSFHPPNLAKAVFNLHMPVRGFGDGFRTGAQERAGPGGWEIN